MDKINPFDLLINDFHSKKATESGGFAEIFVKKFHRQNFPSFSSDSTENIPFAFTLGFILQNLAISKIRSLYLIDIIVQ